MFDTGIISRLIFFDGAAAVVVFFMLSGFSNSIKYFNKPEKTINIIEYIILRFFRLYPPYVLSLLPILFIRRYIYYPDGMEGLSSWALSKWIEYPSIDQIISFSTLSAPWLSEINSTMWTMSILIIITMIFPIVLIPIQKCKKRICIAIILIISYFFASNSSTLLFLPIFVIGAIIAKNASKIKFTSNRKFFNSFAGLFLLTIAVLLLNARFILPYFFGFKSLPDHNIIIDSINSLSCIIIIVFSIVESRYTKLFANKLIDYIGTISYSFYLLHFPIILATTSIVHPITNSAVITILVSFVFSIVTATLYYNLIELKSKKFGNSLFLLVNSQVKKENR